LTIRVSEAVVKVLEDLNVETVFGIPGRWVNPLYIALSESKIKHVLMRHEQAAAHAADGYARVSGKVGVCLATAGPGALGLVLGIATAYKDHVPLLAITGQVPLKLKGKRVTEELNLVNIFKHITKMSLEITNPSKAYEQIFLAAIEAQSECPAPVHVSIPEDVQRSKTSIRKQHYFKKHRTTPRKEDVDIVSEMLNKAEKPLILAGQGVLLSNAEHELWKLVKKTSIPIITTLMARGIIPEDNPLNLGFAGYYGSIEANRAFAESDLVLALGCSLSYNTMFHIKPKEKTIVQVDVSEHNFNKEYATLTIKSDVETFIAKLLGKVKPRSRVWIKGGKQQYRLKNGKGLSIAKILSKELNRKTVFVLDIGEHTLWSISSIKAYMPRTIILPGNLATVGYSLPAAIGAKLAKPKMNTVAVMGDGGFYASSSELGIIKQYNIPIMIVVYNNKYYGLTKKFQEKIYRKSFGVYLGDFSCAKIAEAYGILSYVVSKPEELKEIIPKNIEEPLLIEIPLGSS